MNDTLIASRESISRSGCPLRFHVAIASLCLLLILISAQAFAERSNFVLIVADDLGYGDVGCYGNTENKTPHIDAMAAAGVRFTDCHSAGPM